MTPFEPTRIGMDYVEFQSADLSYWTRDTWLVTLYDPMSCDDADPYVEVEVQLGDDDEYYAMPGVYSLDLQSKAIEVVKAAERLADTQRVPVTAMTRMMA